MFDVSKEEIKSLNDSDLRILVGLLCEAELYSFNNKTSNVMYGGNQDEPDNGIDVLVKASKIGNNEEFFLKNNTIFQVKKPSMPSSKIKDEMLDSTKKIRACIVNLNLSGGTYIIVSSKDDLTQPRYEKRIKTMNELLSKEKLNNVVVDFYDCGRLASWIRNYPSLICWVKDKVGLTTNGWVSYCNWSSRNTKEKTFLYDENSTIYKNDFSNDSKIKIEDGINEIRILLSKERNSIRLAGLSGVGKTRFAQVLFDSKIGKKALNKEIVIYGDISDNLKPDPITFIQQLQKLNKKIILIVDNCEPSMHNKLTKICQYENSLISLLTIEYEVKEDDNIDSNNYYLSSTSSKILKSMLKRDYANISDINIDTIVNCSDGNFRIAIYLSKTIENEKNIGVLNYNDLFSRLFYQGGVIDNELLKVGEACSIFYSFNCNYDEENEENELNIISRLTGIDPLTIYRSVSDLTKRQIIQKRGDMRALLPPALANKLAIDFLRKYPIDNLLIFINKNERLSLSFFRRIKFLHTSDEAQKIGKMYVSQIKSDNILDLDKQTIEKIRCISIINPLLVLEKIESIEDISFFSRDNDNFNDWIFILCIIAYNKELFKRAVKIITKFALTEKENENYNSIKHTLNGFFHIYLSFTLAPVEYRLEIVNELIKSIHKSKVDLGFKLLEEMLLTGDFTGVVISDCGSQLRDYGIEPIPKEWYGCIIEYCENNLKEENTYENFKSILIKYFKELASIGFYNELEKIVINNIDRGSWKSLWLSLLSIKHFDSDKISEPLMKKIDNLIQKVRPTSLEDKTDVYLGTNKNIYYDLDDTTDDFESADELIYELGKELGRNDDKIFKCLSLLSNYRLSRLDKLATGIMDTYGDYNKLIYNTLDLYNQENNNAIKILVTNFVNIYHTKSIKDCADFLEDVIKNKKYCIFYTLLQLSYNLDLNDVKRIKEQISFGICNKEDMRKLEFYISKLDENSFLDLINYLGKYEFQIELIIESLYHYSKNNNVSDEFKNVSRKYISNIDFEFLKKNNNIYNYIASKLTEISFDNQKGVEEANIIFNKVNSLLEDKYISFYDLEKILVPLIQKYSKNFLDIFVDYNGEPSFLKKEFIKKHFNEKNVLTYIDDNVIIEWLKDNNKIEEISYIIEPIYYEAEKECYYWTDLGNYLINRYYENEVIIKNVLYNIFPNSWSNEYSTVLKKRVNLYNELKNSDNPRISEIGEKKCKEIEDYIKYHLQKEKEENEKRFNTFE